MTFQYRPRCVFAAKIEATPGTAEALTASEGVFNVTDFELDPDISFQQRPGQGGIGRRSAIPEGHKAVVRFRTEIAYDGENLPTWASVLLPACGFVNNGSGVFYPTFERPASNVKTLTIGRYLDGTRRIARGCSGTFTVNLPTGKMGFIDWEFTGIWGGETDTAIIAPAYPTEPALRVTRGSSSYNSVNFCARQVTIAAANTITGLECNDDANNDTGFHYFFISDRLSTATTDPLSVLMATQNRSAALVSGTESAFTVGVGGPAGSSVVFSAPKAQIMSKTGGARDALSVDNCQFQFNRNGNAHNQEMSITFNESP